jgi:hypothetical protein
MATEGSSPLDLPELGPAAAGGSGVDASMNQKPELSLLDQERERLKKVPKEQQETLAKEVRARYPNVFSLADKLQVKPEARALLKKAL